MLDRDDEQVIKEAKDGGAVLVTWDRVVRQAAGGLTPYEAMDQAKLSGKGTPAAQAEMSRLRSLTPRDLSILVEKGNETYLAFQKHLILTSFEAALVRHLRVERDYSWRAISRYFSGVWHAPWGANQLAGIAICEKAAKVSGEDFMQPPWN